MRSYFAHSPPLPVVSLLLSVSYPQASRSYYLFCNYLFCNYLSVFLFHRRVLAKIFPFHRREQAGSLPVSPWKTGPDHRLLWINFAERSP